MILLIDIMILSFPAESLDARNWSSKRALMDSTERQFWNREVSGCSASIMPVFSSYVRKADSKTARKGVDVDWSSISQVRKKYSFKELVRYEEVMARQRNAVGRREA